MIQHVCKIMQQAEKIYLYQYILTISRLETYGKKWAWHFYAQLYSLVSVQRKEEYWCQTSIRPKYSESIKKINSIRTSMISAASTNRDPQLMIIMTPTAFASPDRRRVGYKSNSSCREAEAYPATMQRMEVPAEQWRRLLPWFLSSSRAK